MHRHKIIIITGLSGSGKSVALAALEDTGFYCVDNMPVTLLPKFMELPLQDEPDITGLAFVMDMREKGFLSAFPETFQELRRKGFNIEVLFLEADETIILRRYSQTRRHHPLSQDRSLQEGIRAEIKQMSQIRELADRIIDTSKYNVHDLKSVISNLIEHVVQARAMRINILSFGFKHGTPHDADLIMDVRFTANPFFVPELKPLDGRNQSVRNFVLNNTTTRTFMEKFHDLVDFLLPLYEKEGKAYLTIAVGCTGGQHRSVAISAALYEYLNKPGRPVRLTHRDVDIKNGI
ncbi:MAG: RNase adapter RapZ [Desulfobacteraceae bacterium]|nr:RNase adapter RapZ [Desulfobacteraceae bacterium]